jgi:hypothetical protein
MKKFYSLVLVLMILNSLHTLAQTPIFFEPAALEATVNPNSSAEVHTILHNASAATVAFSFPGFTNKDQGGPDSYGYTWIDSDEPNGPDWAWTDITETGSEVEGLGDDMMVGPFEMSFNFPFYGQEKNHFWISPNGCIGFTDQQLPFANGPIPTNAENTDFIAWFWDDLYIDAAMTHVYIRNFEEKTIVQFNNMVHFPGTESFITAQLIMMANGTIIIRYKQLSDGFDTNSATVGLQSANPETGLQVVMNEDYIHPELAIRFNLTHTFITSLHPASLTLLPGQQETIWITYSSAGFEVGNYEQELLCVTDHPEIPQLFVHNVMHIANPEMSGFKGYVTDAATGLAIVEAKVMVGEHQVFTNENGFYELPLENGSYNVSFSKNGYQTRMIEDTTAVAGYSTLDVGLEGFYFLAGRVYAGESPIESGFAYGYKMLEGTVVDVFAEMVGVEGWFEFSGLSWANYIVKAEPSPTSVYYGDYLPTYYGDVIHWEDASVIDLIHSTDDAHIHLVAATNAPAGPGSISGSIVSGNRTADIPIILHSNDQGTVTMQISSIDGTFAFTNLAYGTYDIFAEIPGVSVTPQTIVLNAENPTAEGINMIILGNEIIFLGLIESAVFESEPLIFPNPVTDQVKLSINLKKSLLVHIEITDISGRIISAENHNISDEKNIAIDVTKLTKGLYMLRCEAGGELIVRKFMKE